MQCVRCQAEDSEPARFCRACGYPYVFGELMSCPVCGGEVRAGSKICPGCHHQFSIAVTPDHSTVPKRRTSRYALPVTGALALTGLAFFYVSAGSRPVLEESNPRTSLLAVTESKTMANKNEAEPPSTNVVPALEHSVEREPVAASAAEAIARPEIVAAPAPEKTTEPRTASTLKQPKAVRPLRGGTPQATRTSPAREEPKVQQASKVERATPEPKTEAPPPNSAETGAAEPTVREEPKVREERLTVTQPAAALDVAPAPKSGNGAHQVKPEVKPNGANSGIVERGKVSGTKRGAPVEERSRVARPDQLRAIARENNRARCQGKWEGECRQFPDHKPNW